MEFIDMRGLLALNRHAAASGTVLVLRSPPRGITRLLEADVLAVRVEGRP